MASVSSREYQHVRWFTVGDYDVRMERKQYVALVDNVHVAEGKSMATSVLSCSSNTTRCRLKRSQQKNASTVSNDYSPSHSHSPPRQPQSERASAPYTSTFHSPTLPTTRHTHPTPVTKNEPPRHIDLHLPNSTNHYQPLDTLTQTQSSPTHLAIPYYPHPKHPQAPPLPSLP